MPATTCRFYWPSGTGACGPSPPDRGESAGTASDPGGSSQSPLRSFGPPPPPGGGSLFSGQGEGGGVVAHADGQAEALRSLAELVRQEAASRLAGLQLVAHERRLPDGHGLGPVRARRVPEPPVEEGAERLRADVVNLDLDHHEAIARPRQDRA